MTRDDIIKAGTSEDAPLGPLEEAGRMAQLAKTKGITERLQRQAELELNLNENDAGID